MHVYEGLVVLMFSVGLAGWSYQAMRKARVDLPDAATAVGLSFSAVLALVGS